MLLYLGSIQSPIHLSTIVNKNMEMPELHTGPEVSCGKYAGEWYETWVYSLMLPPLGYVRLEEYFRKEHTLV